jgi:hypothetical protein
MSHRIAVVHAKPQIKKEDERAGIDPFERLNTLNVRT